MAGTVFTVTGLSRLASDYKHAPDEKKNFVLAHDSLVLGASALGVAGYGFMSKKITNNKITQKGLNFVKDSLKNAILPKKSGRLSLKVLNGAKEIVSRCFDNTLMLGAGIAGAIGADYAINAVRLDKRLNSKKVTMVEDESFKKIYDAKKKIVTTFKDSGINKNLENTVGSDVKTGMYNRVFDFPAMRMFTTSMVGMQGFEVIEEKTLKSRMKHATKCLIANSMVPVFFLTTATKLTQGLNQAIRLPLTFATMIFGTMYTNKYIDNHLYKHSAKKEQNQSQNILA